MSSTLTQYCITNEDNPQNSLWDCGMENLIQIDCTGKMAQVSGADILKPQDILLKLSTRLAT